MRTSFILHNDIQASLDILSNAEAGKFIKAVVHYSCFGEMPDKLRGATAILFSVVRAQLDRDNDKYERISAARSASGKKGAAVRNGKPPEEAQEQESPPQAPELDKEMESLMLLREKLQKEKGFII